MKWMMKWMPVFVILSYGCLTFAAPTVEKIGFVLNLQMRTCDQPASDRTCLTHSYGLKSITVHMLDAVQNGYIFQRGYQREKSSFGDQEFFSEIVVTRWTRYGKYHLAINLFHADRPLVRSEFTMWLKDINKFNEFNLTAAPFKTASGFAMPLVRIGPGPEQNLH